MKLGHLYFEFTEEDIIETGHEELTASPPYWKMLGERRTKEELPRKTECETIIILIIA
jgi:hypothetical protein